MKHVVPLSALYLYYTCGVWGGASVNVGFGKIISSTLFFAMSFFLAKNTRAYDNI
jgi:hypothetical protein